MTISNIEVSLFPSESALSKYAIKHTTIIFEKRLILAWWVTYMSFTISITTGCIAMARSKISSSSYYTNMNKSKKNQLDNNL